MGTDENENPPTGITDLSCAESGIWIVATRDSQHRFDLNQGTVERMPGPRAYPSINDRPRRIRTIDTARVGERGAWSMHADEDSDFADYLWADTSAIASITRAEAQ